MTFDDYMALMANVNITVSSYDPARQISKLIIGRSGGIKSCEWSVWGRIWRIAAPTGK